MQNGEVAGQQQERKLLKSRALRSHHVIETSHQDSRGPSQSTDAKADFVPRAATLLQRALTGPDSDLIELLGALPDPSPTARCASPTCGKAYTWDGRGRPRRFCSDSCRGTFNRERRRLLQELEAYGGAHEKAGLPVATRNLVNNRIAVLKMQLDQYRPFSTDTGDA